MLTPNDLADELGVDSRQVRNFLREIYPRSAAEKHQRWHLTPAMADAVRRHFR